LPKIKEMKEWKGREEKENETENFKWSGGGLQGSA
jgi:hypothetical protein